MDKSLESKLKRYEALIKSKDMTIEQQNMLIGALKAENLSLKDEILQKEQNFQHELNFYDKIIQEQRNLMKSQDQKIKEIFKPILLEVNKRSNLADKDQSGDEVCVALSVDTDQWPVVLCWCNNEKMFENCTYVA